MKEILFPKIADNNFKGHKLIMWVLYLYVFKSLIAGAIHMFASDGGAQSIGSVLLDSFTQGGSDTVVTVFGLWGMEQFVIGLIVLVILWRYKSLILFAWAIYAVEYSGRALTHLYTPGLFTEHTPPGAVLDTILVPLAIVMFLLALYSSKKAIDKR